MCNMYSIGNLSCTVYVCQKQILGVEEASPTLNSSVSISKLRVKINKQEEQKKLLSSRTARKLTVPSRGCYCSSPWYKKPIVGTRNQILIHEDAVPRNLSISNSNMIISVWLPQSWYFYLYFQ